MEYLIEPDETTQIPIEIPPTSPQELPILPDGNPSEIKPTATFGMATFYFAELNGWMSMLLPEQAF